MKMLGQADDLRFCFGEWWRRESPAQKRRRQQAELAAQVAHEAAVDRLCNDIINAGFRVLAQRLHPDKGGTDEVMSMLVEARRRLRNIITAE
jgi:hypothetical protein